MGCTLQKQNRTYLAPLLICIFVAATAIAQAPTGAIKGSVFIVDRGSRSYIPGAGLRIVSEDGLTVREAVADEVGRFSFKSLTEGRYLVTAEQPGMKPSRQWVTVSPGAPVEIALEMKLEEVKEVVTVNPTATETIQPSETSSGSSLKESTLANAPNPDERFETILPLVPGVVRGPDGLINMKGSRTSQGAILVNSATVADPVTGSGGFSLPIDVVSNVQVIANPFDAQYGKLAGAVAILDTRTSAFDKYHFTVQNFMPRMRVRDGSIVGIESTTPRMTFTGPLKRDRLAITQSFEYRFVRTPVETLPPLERDMKVESLDSFTQVDAKLSVRQTAAMSLSVFPQKLDYLGLNTFTPQVATPDFHQRGYLFSFQHHYMQNSGALLTSQVSFKDYDADVLAHSDELYRIEVETKEGGFFHRQHRETSRVELQETYQFHPFSMRGLHSPKIGASLVRTSYDGWQDMMPVEVLRASGLPAERLDFGQPASVIVNQKESTAFVTDKWTVRPAFTLDLGFRYDHDSLTGGDIISPRIGFALAPGRYRRTVFRGGAGVFYDKVNLNVPSFVWLPERVVTSYDSDGVPLQSIHYTYTAPERLRNPRSVAWNAELDHELSGNLVLRLSYQQRQTVHDFIVEPLDLGANHYLALSDSGRGHYREFQVTSRYHLHRHEFNASFVRSTANGDLNDFNQFFGNTPQPVMRQNEKSQLPFDVPNRLLLWGQFEVGHSITLSPVLDLHTGFPYSVVNEELDFVGPRNRAGRFPVFSSFDLQVTKEVPIRCRDKVRKIRVGIRAFNLFNHYNPRDVQNNLGSGRYGAFLNSVDRIIRGKLVLEF